mgnify:FL=1
MDSLTIVENNYRLIQEERSEFKKSSQSAACTCDLNHVILLFNVPESNASSIAQKIEDDLNIVKSLLPSSESFTHPKNIIRIDSRKPNINRHLKTVCESEE